ncbi:transcriptional regulator, MarR family [Actinopolyspora xinjiangensis]|uniref:Transcriptional regulator, MarR family n=1 Tax=Actinopolyspora xinjiangensis TaxID=405564 RepID=A0A1H0Q511_9ACTN|nr:MarR family transcriptional regulator [Actinopolyspora xinjiangensis]SDP11758.1 transcriptional regulator, MarR family [Actinopolyspora xinjiangensis]
MNDELGRRCEAALGELLQRRIRVNLYEDLVAGVGRGVDITSYPILSGLARLGPVTAGTLGAEVGLDRSGVSRHATRLEDGGLITRRPDPADARNTLLILTDEGESTVAVLRDRLAGIFEQQLRSWPSHQAEQFVAGLERFVRENHDRSFADIVPGTNNPLATTDQEAD